MSDTFEMQMDDIRKLLTEMSDSEIHAINAELIRQINEIEEAKLKEKVANLEPIPLYMQREWVGLTGLEVVEAYRSVSDKEWAIGGLDYARVFFCAIEAKLKEKNT